MSRPSMTPARRIPLLFSIEELTTDTARTRLFCLLASFDMTAIEQAERELSEFIAVRLRPSVTGKRTTAVQRQAPQFRVIAGGLR